MELVGLKTGPVPFSQVPLSNIESINSSFRKVTKKGPFLNDEAVMKVFYLQIQELQRKKWKGKGHVANWPAVRNQLLIDDRIGKLIVKYDGLN